MASHWQRLRDSAFGEQQAHGPTIDDAPPVTPPRAGPPKTPDFIWWDKPAPPGTGSDDRPVSPLTAAYLAKHTLDTSADGPSPLTRLKESALDTPSPSRSAEPQTDRPPPGWWAAPPEQAEREGLDDASVGALMRMFHAADVDSSGTISMIEAIKAIKNNDAFAHAFGFESATRVRQEDGTRELFMQAFHDIDANNDHELSWPELLAFARRVRSTPPAPPAPGPTPATPRAREEMADLRGRAEAAEASLEELRTAVEAKSPPARGAHAVEVARLALQVRADASVADAALAKSRAADLESRLAILESELRGREAEVRDLRATLKTAVGLTSSTTAAAWPELDEDRLSGSIVVVLWGLAAFFTVLAVSARPLLC